MISSLMIKVEKWYELLYGVWEEPGYHDTRSEVYSLGLFSSYEEAICRAEKRKSALLSLSDFKKLEATGGDGLVILPRLVVANPKKPGRVKTIFSKKVQISEP